MLPNSTGTLAVIESLDSEQLIINSIDNSSIAFRLFITVDVFSIFIDSESFNHFLYADVDVFPGDEIVEGVLPEGVVVGPEVGVVGDVFGHR